MRPSHGGEPMLAAAWARTAHQGVAAVEALRARVRELEHALRRAERGRDAAYEAGVRDARAAAARTHGGRLPSILTAWRGGDA